MTGYPEEGSSVSYVGIPRQGLAVGDIGSLLATAGRGAHVKWTAGGVTLEDIDDLAPVPTAARHAAAHDGLEDSLEVGAPAGIGLAHLCALRGPQAVLGAIETARPPDLAEAVRDVRIYARQRVATAPTMREVIAQLPEEEGAELIRLATTTLLQDAFGISDG